MLAQKQIKLLADLADETRSKLVAKVVREIQSLPEHCRQSGDLSALDNIWEEFKDQIQTQESVFFDAYEATVRQACSVANQRLSEPAAGLLWVMGHGFLNADADADHEIPFGEILDSDLENELYSLVVERASDEPMKQDVIAGICPSSCDCLGEDLKLARDTIYASEPEARVVDESHFWIYLVRCQKCFQLFAVIFAEMVDWDEGNDPQHWIHVPIFEWEGRQINEAGEAAESFLTESGMVRRMLIRNNSTDPGITESWYTGRLMLLPHD